MKCLSSWKSQSEENHAMFLVSCLHKDWEFKSVSDICMKRYTTSNESFNEWSSSCTSIVEVFIYFSRHE